MSGQIQIVIGPLSLGYDLSEHLFWLEATANAGPGPVRHGKVPLTREQLLALRYMIDAVEPITKTM